MNRPRSQGAAAVALVGLLVVLQLAAGGGPVALAAEGDGADALATELVRLRGETESLSAELQLQREEHRARLRSLATQRADLELTLRRETLRRDRLQAALTERRAQVKAASDARDDLTPAVAAAIDTVAGTVDHGLPFLRSERRAQFQRLRDQLRDGLLRPEDALARLWDRVEDELRLTRESGLYSQVITRDDEELLVDVVRVGMVMLFYRTRQGEVGRAVPADDSTEGSWRFAPYRSEDERLQVAALFDAFDKQIRVGFFTLPNALAAQEGRALDHEQTASSTGEPGESR